MRQFKRAEFLAMTALVGLLAAPFRTPAQNLTTEQLVHPPPDSWPGYHGDYSGRRHSSLKQITPANVEQLGLAWAFQTGQPQPIKSTPILVDGILYFTVARQYLGRRRAVGPSDMALQRCEK